MDRILSIDPGGKSGVYFTDGKHEEFFEINNKNWKENYLAIKELVQQKKANLVLFEDTNYIHKKIRNLLNIKIYNSWISKKLKRLYQIIELINIYLKDLKAVSIYLLCYS